jgi:hypothetical protein
MPSDGYIMHFQLHNPKPGFFELMLDPKALKL